MRSDEKALTGDDLAKAKTTVIAAVPGETIIRAETDTGDAAYEIHMTKAEGSLTTVKLDKNFVLVKVETGVGMGDPHRGGPDRPQPLAQVVQAVQTAHSRHVKGLIRETGVGPFIVLRRGGSDLGSPHGQ